MKSMRGRLLYLLDENTGLLFDRMHFYLVHLHTGERSLVCKMPVGKKVALMSLSRILSRLKRLEPKCAGRLSDTEFVVSLLRSIWMVDVKKKSCTKLCDNPEGFSEVINFCSTEDGVYWGDYGRNTEHREVRMYQVGADRQVSVVYTFEAWTVRHIHNIVEDGEGFLLFVGDNEAKAGIYRVNHDWTEVVPLRTGDQKYRAVVGWPYQGGVLYATDSVETENHIRLISADGEEKELCSLNGSCIYGCETKGYYLFSTTVEPHEGRGVKALFVDSPGGGIKSRNATVMAVSKYDLSVLQVASFRKDRWPMKLFQYGRAIFAGGQTNTNNFWCSPVACKKYDGKSIKIDISE